jgi:hypothetical protein
MEQTRESFSQFSAANISEDAPVWLTCSILTLKNGKASAGGDTDAQLQVPTDLCAPVAQDNN